MKNKGMIISGGKLNVTNLVFDGEITIINNDKPQTKKPELSLDNIELISVWKDEIAKGNLKEVIPKLIDYFTEVRHTEMLNATIMTSYSLFELQKQENLEVINYQDSKVARAKIINSILQIIDTINSG